MFKAHFPELGMSEKKEGQFLNNTCPENECDGTPVDWMPLSKLVPKNEES